MIAIHVCYQVWGEFLTRFILQFRILGFPSSFQFRLGPHSRRFWSGEFFKLSLRTKPDFWRVEFSKNWQIKPFRELAYRTQGRVRLHVPSKCSQLVSYLVLYQCFLESPPFRLPTWVHETPPTYLENMSALPSWFHHALSQPRSFESLVKLRHLPPQFSEPYLSCPPRSLSGFVLHRYFAPFAL